MVCRGIIFTNILVEAVPGGLSVRAITIRDEGCNTVSCGACFEDDCLLSL